MHLFLFGSVPPHRDVVRYSIPVQERIAGCAAAQSPNALQSAQCVIKARKVFGNARNFKEYFFQGYLVKNLLFIVYIYLV